MPRKENWKKNARKQQRNSQKFSFFNKTSSPSTSAQDEEVPSLSSFEPLEGERHQQKSQEAVTFEENLQQYGILQSEFIQIFPVFWLLSTLPVTVASLERSIGKLKLIKDYLRSQMGQSRLSSLALLSIESKVAYEMDLTTVINEFANKKVRKRNF